MKLTGIMGMVPMGKQTKKKINEEYIELIADYGAEEGLEQIVQAWVEWKTGPMTEKDDIKPARKELLNYCMAFLKKHIK